MYVIAYKTYIMKLKQSWFVSWIKFPSLYDTQYSILLQEEKCKTWKPTKVEFEQRLLSKEPEYANKCPSTVETSSDCEPECWSPGVLDVDCPTGNLSQPFALCCHNGCANKCIQPTFQDCVTVTVQQCNYVPKPICHVVEVSTTL